MKIQVRESTIVKPEKDTPSHRLWASDLDLVVPSYHVKTIYFYRPKQVSSDEPSSFFDANVLKDALAQALVEFYPLAGRLARNKDGRIEIHCNSEGALFLEAATTWSIDDLGDLTTTLKLSQLVPEVDCSLDLSAHSLLLVQIQVKESTVVQPAKDTPSKRLWASDLDLVVPSYHVKTIYFYRPKQVSSDEPSSFFEPNVLKDALAQALVEFYPLAGRLARDKDGRIEINCSSEGALFVKATTTWSIDDLGDLTTTLNLSQLVPEVDCSLDLSARPLLLVQVTYFICGGVSLGVGINHTLADGTSGIHFLNTWADVTRGLGIRIPPFVDRTPLRAQAQPRPAFTHIEYIPPPALKSTKHVTDPPKEVSVFKLTKAQVNTLKTNATNFSSYMIVAGHVWRSVCKARGLAEDQETKLYIAVDGRSRLQPPLPLGYFGNAIFTTTPMALAGEIQSKPAWYASSKIKDAIARMDNDYLRSTIDYLALQDNITALARGSHSFKCPNLGIVSWTKLPIHEADFGWGKPIYMGPVRITFEGLAYVLPSPTNDGGLSLVICLERDHMKQFGKFLYDI